MNPSLSVIIPNYNHASFLEESLEAILSQSFQPNEIIFVDDASTDNSIAVVKKYNEKHSNIKILQLKENSGGPIIPIKEGLKHATGNYLALCASDDMVLPGFFEEAMNFVSCHPEVGICCGDLSIFRGTKKPYQFKRQRYLRVNQPKLLNPKKLEKICYWTSFQIASQASIYRKDLIQNVGGYDPELDGYSDFYLNYQIAFSHPIAYVPRAWATFRLLTRSYGQGVPSKRRAQLSIKFLEKICSEKPHIQKIWKKSGVLLHCGPDMISCLLENKRFWPFLPYYLPKWGFNWMMKIIRILGGIVRRRLIFVRKQFFSAT